jgi:hypothetical protein
MRDSPRAVRPILYVLLRVRGPRAPVRAGRALRKRRAHTGERNGRARAARSACRTAAVITCAHKTYILYSLCALPSCGGEAVRRGGAQTKRNGVAKKRANRCHTTGSLAQARGGLLRVLGEDFGVVFAQRMLP